MPNVRKVWYLFPITPLRISGFKKSYTKLSNTSYVATNPMSPVELDPYFQVSV